MKFNAVAREGNARKERNCKKNLNFNFNLKSLKSHSGEYEIDY